ncbi:hypothetical protein MTBUT4_470017 [Magnetospirillum sp. UT-4]|nr:hypothetical protein MTBUT4_470017 [Magnetospirillum sp. UT-4]
MFQCYGAPVREDSMAETDNTDRVRRIERPLAPPPAAVQ